MLTLTSGFSDASGEGNLIDRVKTSKAWERAIPDIMHAAGASTSIRRTCTFSKENKHEHWSLKMA